MQILQTNDGFLWGKVTYKAKEIFNSGLFELYVVNHDDSDYLIDDYDKLNELLENGTPIYIILCHCAEIKQLN
jgi:hypothetical protein